MRPIRTTPAVLATALVVLLPTLGALAAPSPSGPPEVARPLILMLHGRGMQGSDTASLRREWSRALGDGIASVAGEPLLAEDDLRLVWYADALESEASGTAAAPGACRRGPPEERREGWARDVGTTLETTGTFLRLAALWLGDAEGQALRALAADLVYLGDDDRRCAAAERLEEALLEAEEEGRTVILLAHSFGALVAYDHLRTRPDTGTTRIERWITVGSLLGHPELREVLLAGGGGVGLPPGVGSWVNVHDPRDPLSAPLVGLKAAGGEPGAILDRVTEKAAAENPHDPERYLSDPATARAVVEAWPGEG